MAEKYVDKDGIVHDYTNMTYGREAREKYELCCQIIKTGKEVLKMTGHDIPITCIDSKYDGWQGTMKPSY